MQFQSQGGIQPGTAAIMDGHVNAHSLVRSSTSGISTQSGIHRNHNTCTGRNDSGQIAGLQRG
jgi:hypothetical protein